MNAQISADTTDVSIEASLLNCRVHTTPSLQLTYTLHAVCLHCNLRAIWDAAVRSPAVLLRKAV